MLSIDFQLSALIFFQKFLLLFKALHILCDMFVCILYTFKSSYNNKMSVYISRMKEKWKQEKEEEAKRRKTKHFCIFFVAPSYVARIWAQCCNIFSQIYFFALSSFRVAVVILRGCFNIQIYDDDDDVPSHLQVRTNEITYNEVKFSSVCATEIDIHTS